MDKPSERKKDAKGYGDTDIGVQDYGAGGKREQLDGLWKYASEKLVDQPDDRRMTNCYAKTKGARNVPGRYEEGLADELIDHGPPLIDESRPKREF